MINSTIHSFFRAIDAISKLSALTPFIRVTGNYLNNWTTTLQYLPRSYDWPRKAKPWLSL